MKFELGELATFRMLQKYMYDRMNIQLINHSAPSLKHYTRTTGVKGEGALGYRRLMQIKDPSFKRL